MDQPKIQSQGRIRPFRVSAKGDLTDAEISHVSQSLVQGDTFSNFFKRCQLIQELFH